MTLLRDPSPVEPVRIRESDALVGKASVRENRHTVPAAERLETFLYLTPVIGVIPAIWALYRRQSDNRQLAVCRLSILLTIVWASAYLSLNLGADLASASPSIAFRLLFMNGLATSGYFISSVWLMVLLWQKKSVRLSGFSVLAERLVPDKADPNQN
jgi:uncharacterized membrane protein YedE/YeeE